MQSKGTISVACAYCGNPFLTWPSLIARGGGLYCSCSCSSRGKVGSLEQRFWVKVNQQDHCWLWTGSKGKHGYGAFSMYPNSPQPVGLAHRYALELRLQRPIQKGFMALHTCDSNYPIGDISYRACVRNDDEGIYEINGITRIRFGHLWEGTHADNMADMVAKKRNHVGDLHPAHVQIEKMRRGSRHGMARLTEAQVLEIRQRAADGAVQNALAAEYGVAFATISHITRRSTWVHI